MKGYIGNIENETLNNENFRKVLFTGKHCQLVVMTLQPGEEIGSEVHNNVDQFFRVEVGAAKVTMDGEDTMIGPEFVAIVPAGVQHNVTNVSATEKLKLYTIYSPANHKPGTIHKTKAEADKAEIEAHHH
ncbi:cupin [candidate division WWE3 bacterium RBG_19FT_COMBO_34_6]|uniref:Cupin n=1 Tax=candidate division WWE3 bacterium RBG_19FT_COMBO_34_6 TaxID=1802612 RepID=A0A1F4ULZ8_UNCKA|nr:MAG: cupin [candidate division WWE3 bacterium RBG_19FT_COMBO_34_6]